MADAKVLPQRSTRGKRYLASLGDEEAKEDAEFWNQEFFAEEAEDIDYVEEKVSEDVPDSDFDDEEDEDDDESGSEVEEKSTKKVLKVPGRQATQPRPKPAAKPQASADGSEPRPKKARTPPPPQIFEAPSLRRSTMAKTIEVKNVLQLREDAKPRKVKKKDDNWRPMTQQELLAEAARTEVDNTASLKLLLALEEETKRKAAIIKKQYQGPLVKFHSKRAGDKDEEKTLFQVCNMHYPPPWLRRMRAPLPPLKSHCLVTGLEARYRDPSTGQPFATAAAFKRLRAQASGLQPPLSAATLAPAPSTHDLDRKQETTAVDRSQLGMQSQQVTAELAQADEVMRQATMPQDQFVLPVALMGLVVDAHSLVSGRR